MNDDNREERRIKCLIALVCLALAMFIAMWMATQRVAARCDYDPLLGRMLYESDTIWLYFPWDYFVWKYKFGEIIPHILASVKSYFLVGLFVGMMLTAFINKHRRPLDSHGTATWGKAKDVKQRCLLFLTGSRNSAGWRM